MPYTPTEWKTGDIITAEKLNKAENAIAEALDSCKEDLSSHILSSIQAKMNWGQILRFRVGHLSILTVNISLDMSKNSPFNGTEVLTDEFDLDDTYHGGHAIAVYTSGNPNMDLDYNPTTRVITCSNYGQTYSTYNSIRGIAFGWVD